MAHESGIKSQHFEPGDLVFSQGDLGDNVYVIQKGECEVIREDSGVARQLAVLRAGDYFGEMAVLSDKTRNASIRVLKSMDVLLIPKDDFDKLRESVPAFGDVFRELANKRAAAANPDA
jgi:CRP-like cAMP-binding protein